MTQREPYQIDPSHHAAIARWDDEGGAAATFRSATDLEGSGNERPPASKVNEDSGDDAHVLDCLGAAVMMRWGCTPHKIQRDLFECATSLPELTQTAQLKGQIARFLHNRKMTAFDR